MKNTVISPGSCNCFNLLYCCQVSLHIITKTLLIHLLILILPIVLLQKFRFVFTHNYTLLTHYHQFKDEFCFLPFAYSAHHSTIFTKFQQNIVIIESVTRHPITKQKRAKSAQITNALWKMKDADYSSSITYNSGIKTPKEEKEPPVAIVAISILRSMRFIALFSFLCKKRKKNRSFIILQPNIHRWFLLSLKWRTNQT